jgi:DNA polymerase-3 subunit chi
MTRVDFYLLPEAIEIARQHFACRLAEKAHHLGNRLFIHTCDSQAASTINELLWTFRADSFLPHAISPASQTIPIHINWNEDNPAHHDLLINLTSTVPSFFSRFERVAEIVSQDAQALTDSRQRFRFYQERGYAIKINDMKKTA